MPLGPRGIICPLVTPLDDDEKLDEPALARQVDRVLGRVDGLLLLGTTGELPVLDDAVADRLVDVVAEQVAGRATLMVGVGDTGTGRARRNLRRAGTSVDFVAACSPYYYPSSDEPALARHFAELADAAAVPLVLYNIPQNTHQPLGWDVVTELSGHDNVVGIKDSSGDADYFRRLVPLSRPDFTVLQGTQERRAAEFLRMGADGFVSGLENVVPGTLQDLVRAVGDGDDEALHRAERRIETAFGILSQGFWLSALKVATGMLVGGGDRPAAPLPPVSPEHRDAIREILVGLGLLPAS